MMPSPPTWPTWWLMAAISSPTPIFLIVLLWKLHSIPTTAPLSTVGRKWAIPTIRHSNLSQKWYWAEPGAAGNLFRGWTECPQNENENYENNAGTRRWNMKMLVTGATGYIGGSVAERLIASGHQVVGLVRSAEKVPLLKERGIESVLGTLDD